MEKFTKNKNKISLKCSNSYVVNKFKVILKKGSKVNKIEREIGFWIDKHKISLYKCMCKRERIYFKKCQQRCI